MHCVGFGGGCAGDEEEGWWGDGCVVDDDDDDGGGRVARCEGRALLPPLGCERRRGAEPPWGGGVYAFHIAFGK